MPWRLSFSPKQDTFPWKNARPDEESGEQRESRPREVTAAVAGSRRAVAARGALGTARPAAEGRSRLSAKGPDQAASGSRSENRLVAHQLFKLAN